MGLLGELLEHPEELPCLLRVRAASKKATVLPKDPDLAFCYDMLNRVSRSFAVVIQQLGLELRDAVCVFYLVLRALDTVEDDMAIPVDVKLPILFSFHQHIHDESWKFVCGVKDYKRLMEKMDSMVRAFLKLDKKFQAVIADITKRMGHGMAKFIEEEVVTVADYDEYCHYVAGLVGLGLSDLFRVAGLEEEVSEELSNHMGLFLQKVNIIRDYLEDINEIPAPRMFWPREVWSKYGRTLEDFKELENEAKAVACLNDLLTDALRHAPHCLTYMARLRTSSVLRFCAIPQIMAIGTIYKCYDNDQVFKGVVKMRKGLAAKVMDKTRSMADVYSAFLQFAMAIRAKVREKDPNSALALQRLAEIEARCKAGAKGLSSHSLQVVEKGATTQRTILWLVLFFNLAYAINYRGIPDKLGVPRLSLLENEGVAITYQVLAVLFFIMATLLLVNSPKVGS